MQWVGSFKSELSGSPATIAYRISSIICGNFIIADSVCGLLHQSTVFTWYNPLFEHPRWSEVASILYTTYLFQGDWSWQVRVTKSHMVIYCRQSKSSLSQQQSDESAEVNSENGRRRGINSGWPSTWQITRGRSDINNRLKLVALITSTKDLTF